MVKMTKEQKQQVIGGIGPMMLWVIIMGIVMGIQTLVQVGEAINSSTATSDTKAKQSSYTATKRSSGYIRMSPFPARSAVSMGL